MRTLILLVAAAISLSGCSIFRLSRPTNLPDYTQHKYVVSVADESGNSIDGTRLTLTKSDLGTAWTNDKVVSSTETVETGGANVIPVGVMTKLTQHWKGGYYSPQNEPELLKQKYPHGGRDIWGYLTELRIAGDVPLLVQTTFTQDASSVSVIKVPIVIKAPSNLMLPSKHTYRFNAVDKNGRSVSGATIIASLADHSYSMGNRQRLASARKVHECTTDLSGTCSLTVPVKMVVHHRSDYTGESAYLAFEQLYSINHSTAYFGYLSSVVAHGALGGFFRSATVDRVRGTVTGAEPEAESVIITVPTPRDYYCDDLKLPGVANSASTLDSWVRTIKLTGDNRNVDLERICQQSFKGKNYIALSFQHKTKFNELKLNNYGIGVLVFDEVVRKLLDPISSASSNLPVDGYKLTVRTQKSNFAEKASPSEYLTYDFFLPKDLVRQYKQADISGQKLVNGSVVLLDSERIDLELK